MSDQTPGPKAVTEDADMPGTIIRCSFDPARRRQEYANRLIQLRLLIPEFQEEKARIEGALSLLDEMVSD